MSNNDYYASVKHAVSLEGGEERVEVNQRNLIDKILARYASAGAVYRELLQNSNDANATDAEIYFTTDRENEDDNGREFVSSVTYRNNGFPFRRQDWSRLKAIAEGNPSPEKVRCHLHRFTTAISFFLMHLYFYLFYFSKNPGWSLWCRRIHHGTFHSQQPFRSIFLLTYFSISVLNKRRTDDCEWDTGISFLLEERSIVDEIDHRYRST